MDKNLKIIVIFGGGNMSYKFEELARDLKIGHEIEFAYRNKNYSITASRKGWHIYNDTDNIEIKDVYFGSGGYINEDSYQTLMEELSKPYIENRSIKEIFECEEYDVDSLGIF